MTGRPEGWQGAATPPAPIGGTCGDCTETQPVCAQAPGGPPPRTRAGLPLLCETFIEWKLQKSNQKVQKLGPHSVAFLCDSKGPKLGAGMSRVRGRMDHDP